MSEEHDHEMDRRRLTEIDRLCDRFTAQDRVLADLRDMIHANGVALAAHVAEEKALSDALRELADVWKARKVLGMVFGGIAAFAAAGWQLWLWAKDHIK